MVSDIYVFDLGMLKWEKVEQVNENVPQARYFHSADTCTSPHRQFRRRR